MRGAKQLEVFQAIIMFLACAVVLLVICVVWLIFRYRTLSDDYTREISRERQVTDTNRDLLRDRFLDAQQIERLKNRVETGKNATISNPVLILDEQPELFYEAPEPQVYSKERLPEGHTNTFRCEDWRLLNMPGSDQLALQQECMTDAETGLRFWYNYYDLNDSEPYICAALAGAYGSTIGDAWRVTLKCGTAFNIIFADFKHPNQIEAPDPFDFGDADRNYDEQPTTSVIEFVYDEKIAPKEMIKAGTMSYFERLGGLYGDGGDIVKLEYLGRKWSK